MEGNKKVGRPIGSRSREYSATFKAKVVEEMISSKLGYRETARRFLPNSTEGSAASLITKWERIYLEHGIDGFTAQHRGRKHKKVINDSGK